MHLDTQLKVRNPRRNRSPPSSSHHTTTRLAAVPQLDDLARTLAASCALEVARDSMTFAPSTTSIQCELRGRARGQAAREVKEPAMSNIQFRIDLSPHCSIGPGKIELLEAIAESGSLRTAARRRHMSYRHAWLLLDSLNRSFTEPATLASVGGRGGGGVTLTAFGTELVQRYHALDRKISKLLNAEFGPLAGKVSESASAAGSASAPRRKRIAKLNRVAPSLRVRAWHANGWCTRSIARLTRLLTSRGASRRIPRASTRESPCRSSRPKY